MCAFLPYQVPSGKGSKGSIWGVRQLPANGSYLRSPDVDSGRQLREYRWSDTAKFKWLDEINKPFVAARPAAVAPIDPAAAALLDEDLDYRIAKRIGSLDGWRSFLTAHGSGVHAQSAREEVGYCSLMGQGREALPDVDAFGCLCSLRARSALDGVSWVQSG